MALVDRVNAALAESRSTEQRAIGGVPWRPWSDPYVRFDVGGPLHPSKTAGMGGIDGALSLQPVYSCVRFLAEGVAKLPLQQFRDTGERKMKMPLGQLLAKPSAYLNLFDWLYQYVSSAALTGTAWGLITARDGYGFPTTIEWLPPERMFAQDSEPFNPAKTQIFYAGREVPREQLLIIRAFTIPGRTAGISPLRNFQLLFETGMNALAYGSGWYESGGMPPGVFQNSQYEVDDELSEGVRKKLVQAQRRRVPLVIGRDWTYTPIKVPPNEAQFVEAQQLTATQVASIYGVQPRRAGGIHGDSQTYSNTTMDQIAEISDTLDPWLIRFETAMADCLPSQQYAQFNRTARLRSAPVDRFAVYRAARDIGAMNIDEIRDLEDMPPIPRPVDADDYDGQDYTPLQIQVAAARGIKEIIGEGVGPGGGGTVETNPQTAKTSPAPAVPAGKPAPAHASAANGSSNGKANGQRPRPQ